MFGERLMADLDRKAAAEARRMMRLPPRTENGEAPKAREPRNGRAK
jgi:hypothetical protein